MARVLIVAYGRRAVALGSTLQRQGYVVRLALAEAVPEARRLEPLTVDPLRLATLHAALSQVTVACWLMGEGPAAAAADLCGSRIESFARMAVDAGARGLVFEPHPAARSAPRDPLARTVAAFSLRFTVLDPSLSEPRWLEAAAKGVARALAEERP